MRQTGPWRIVPALLVVVAGWLGLRAMASGGGAGHLHRATARHAAAVEPLDDDDGPHPACGGGTAAEHATPPARLACEIPHSALAPGEGPHPVRRLHRTKVPSLEDDDPDPPA
jgi:hypothetical protein